MIVERLPEVLALPTEQKEMLAEELLNQVVLEQENQPAYHTTGRSAANCPFGDDEMWRWLKEPDLADVVLR